MGEDENAHVQKNALNQSEKSFGILSIIHIGCFSLSYIDHVDVH